MKFTCADCGGTNVQVKAWVNPNTDEIVETMQDEMEDCWCDNCEEHVTIIRED